MKRRKKQVKKTKRILSLVLAVLMLVSVMPMVYAEGNNYKTGDIIQFGSYPQSEVKDEILINELNALAPEWDEWTNYGYYSGKGAAGSMIQGNWMRYIDVDYKNEKYRGVMFTLVRPGGTISRLDKDKIANENGYECNKIYWFEFNELNWIVLDPATGFIMCERAIDSQPYNNTAYFSQTSSGITLTSIQYSDKECKIYSNDYATSSIRAWLNDDFFNLSFTDSEQELIYKNELDNRCEGSLKGHTGYERYDGNTTSDKVFLMSYSEVRNSDYGFYTKNSNEISRTCFGTDYAKCQGLTVTDGDKYEYSDVCMWILRTADHTTKACCHVSDNAKSTGYSHTHVTATYHGIRPAMRIDLSLLGNTDCRHQNTETSHKINPTCTENGFTEGVYCNNCETWISGHEEIFATGHSYNTETVQPTCKAAGYTLYTCDCGYNYIDDLTDRVMHKDDNDDYRCDYGCGLFMGEGMEASDPPCSCNCHKGGIAGFFWKIANFFNKLFKIKSKQMCACGEAHY